MYRVEASHYGALCGEIARRFGLKPVGRATVGLDEAFQDYRSGDLVLGLEWDIWSGFIVVAKNASAEPLLHQVADYLREHNATGA